MNLDVQCALTLGISTARSTVNGRLSLALTPILVGQLPTNVSSVGGSKATVQFVSSVGRGDAYGTATPFFSRAFAAANACFALISGSDLRKE